MSDENEVQQEESVEGTYHEAVNLWPLAVLGAVAGLVFLLATFLPDAKHREQMVPSGKAYTAIGQIVDCQPMSMSGNGAYRSFVRTPKDEFFSVYWRRDFQPPIFGAALGELKYHQCGSQDGVAVHCFDAFAVSTERVKILDLNPVLPTATKK